MARFRFLNRWLGIAGASAAAAMSPTPTTSASSLELHAGEELRVGTWNVFGGRAGLTKIWNQFQTGHLGSCQVVYLQETWRGEQGITARLAREFDYQYHVQEGSDGIISRFPIVAKGKVHLNKVTGRRAVWATLLVNHPTETLIRVYSVHLTYKWRRWPFVPRLRLAEARRIERHLRASDAAFDGPTIIAGDFNSIGSLLVPFKREACIDHFLNLGFQDAVNCRRRTHVIGRLDWILARGFEQVGSVTGPFSGSDHRWLLARLKLPPDRPVPTPSPTEA